MKILSMSGFIPEQICDVVRFTGYSGERNITHFCGYANDYISQVLNDESIDGAVFPKSCDSTRVINSYIEDAHKFSFQLNIPARNDDITIKYFAKEIEQYKNAIEKHFGVAITDIPERIEKINQRNKIIGGYYNELEKYSYTDYINQVHALLNTPVSDELTMSVEEKQNKGVRTFIVGSFLSNTDIARCIEKNGFCVVGDNLPESGRIKDSTIDEVGDNVYETIARNILARRISPTQSDFISLINLDLEIIKSKKVEAVIFITQKYCEPYDYMYSAYKKILDQNNIPSLKITLNDSQDDRKVDLLLEAFAGTL